VTTRRTPHGEITASGSHKVKLTLDQRTFEAHIENHPLALRPAKYAADLLRAALQGHHEESRTLKMLRENVHRLEGTVEALIRRLAALNQELVSAQRRSND
jgi:hypothetical protein